MSSSLFSPLRIADFEIANRVVLAPLTRARAGEERIPNALMREYYTQRCGAGLLISEATAISTDAIGWLNTPGIYNDAQVAGWRLITDAIHEAGSRVFLQLWHCGRTSHSTFSERAGRPPLAPSAVRLEDGTARTPQGKLPYETPKEMTPSEIEQTIKDYAHAARRARDAGFDGVELHAANGYLIDQFLQSCSNQRDDNYGGSVATRFRFLAEVVEACKAHIAPNRIGVRLSPNGAFNGMGSEDFRETFLFAAQSLSAMQIGYLHVLDGLAFGFHELGEPVTLSELRSVFPGVIVGNCGYTKGKAEKAVAEGVADLIAFGRPFIANPDLAERLQNNWPLAPEAPVEHWYSSGPEGYIDYPSYTGNES